MASRSADAVPDDADGGHEPRDLAYPSGPYNHFVKRFRPEIAAGGYCRDDGTVSFYSRINALISPKDIVLDFGAGRGRVSEDRVDFRRNLGRLKGKCSQVIGVDIDPAVCDNPLLDKAHILRPGAGLPFEDATFDLITSDWVFEHVTDPETVAKELSRVLKPGGWLCARTPNKWGYFAVAARAIPDRLHHAILRRTTSHRLEKDIFPTVYRMNTIRALAELFGGFDNYSYPHAAEPGYHANSAVLWRLIAAYNAVVPGILKPVLHIFMKKRYLATHPVLPTPDSLM